MSEPIVFEVMASVRNMEKKTYLPQARLLLIRGGKEYFDCLYQLIQSAGKCIHIQMYIFSNDATGQMVMGWLRAAAARGVCIYVLIDGYASAPPLDWIHNAAGTNLHIGTYEPLLRTSGFYFGRRLHHKIVVADSRCALVGSNNIDDHYYGSAYHPAWMDMALYEEGCIAGMLEQICIQLWNKATNDNLQPVPMADDALHPEKRQDSISVRIRRNDWINNKQEIAKSYFNLLNKARENVYLVSSYFLPGRRLRKQMKLAAQRGVRVSVITAGLSDVKIAKQAERYLYPWLLRNNIEVYEYQDSILHAKLGVRDERWLTIGSFNINNISTYASIELNLEVRNRPFVKKVAQELDRLMTDSCVRITEQRLRDGDSFLVRLVQRFSYDMIRIILYLFTFYFKRDRVGNKFF